MKNTFKSAISLFIITALLFSLAIPSFADEAETVLWPWWDYENSVETTVELPYLGELSEGKNNISANSNNCCSFTAAQTGYWLFSDIEAVEVSTATEANRVTSVCRAQHCWYNDTNGGYCVYLEKDVQTYLCLYTEESNAVFVDYLGEIVSVFPERDYAYKHELDLIDDTERVSAPYRPYLQMPVTVSFSTGKMVSFTYLYGKTDSADTGRRLFKADLFNGHGFDLEFTLKDSAEIVDSVVLPEDFISGFLLQYKNFRYDDSLYSDLYEMPEFVEIRFKDGSIKRFEIEIENPYYGYVTYYFNLDDGSEHMMNIGYRKNGNGRIAFAVGIDYCDIYEAEPDICCSAVLLDLQCFAQIIGCLGQAAKVRLGEGMPFIDTAHIFFTDLSAEINLFIDYYKYIIGNGYTFTASVPTALFKALISDLSEFSNR